MREIPLIFFVCENRSFLLLKNVKKEEKVER